MSFTRDLIKGAKNALRKKTTISWERDSHEPTELIWRLPSVEYKNLSAIDQLIVKEYERVALFKAGVFSGVLAQGEHKLSSDTDEIIFVDTSPKTQVYGIRKSQGLITKDKFRFGFSGKITFRVKEDNVDIGNFLTKIVSSRNSFNERHLIRWLREGPLLAVFREITKNLTLEQFRTMNRRKLNMETEAKLGTELSTYGIEFISNIIMYFTSPQIK